MGDNPPDQQRAWVNIGRGTPAKALVLRSDWPVSKKLRPGEVLVKVHAAALNPVGYKFYQYLPDIIAGRPRVAEYDLSGVIVDSNGTRFENGDHIFGWVPSNQFRRTNQGALSQYCKLSSDWMEKRPPNVTAIQAAGLTLVGLTAYKAVVDIADVQAGQRVFVNGGSSSVGAISIQISKIKGAHVAASASARNEQFVRQLGADEFVDYTSNDLPTYLTESARDKKFDYIIDAIGTSDPSLYYLSDKYLSPMGAFISVGPNIRAISLSEFRDMSKNAYHMCLPRFLGGIKASFKIVMVMPQRKGLEELRKYVSDGSLKPVVDSVFAFDDVLKAYDRLMTSRATGKVIVKVDPLIE